MGVIVQADVLLEAAIRREKLIRLLPDWELPTRPVQLVTPRRHAPSAKLRSFVDFMSDKLG